MTERTLRKVASGQEQNARYTRRAIAAANLQDNLMDVVKMFNGFLRLRSLYLGSPQRFDLSQLIHLIVDEHKERYKAEFGDRDREEMPDVVFDRLGTAFIDCFVTNSASLGILETDQYHGKQVKLVALRPLAKGEVLKGLDFILVRLASEDQVVDSDEEPIDVRGITRKSDGSRFLQLGPSFWVNHHCDRKKRNVNYLGTVTKRPKPLGTGLVYQPVLIRAVDKGEELLAGYSYDEFFDESEPCLCTATHLHQDQVAVRRLRKLSTSKSQNDRTESPKRKQQRTDRLSTQTPSLKVVIKVPRPPVIPSPSPCPTTTASSDLTTVPDTSSSSVTQETPSKADAPSGGSLHDRTESEIESEFMYGDSRDTPADPAPMKTEMSADEPSDSRLDIRTWLLDIGEPEFESKG